MGRFLNDLDESEVNWFLQYNRSFRDPKKNLISKTINFTDFCSLIALGQVIIHQFQSF